MIVGEMSPFFKLPAKLDARQRVLFDGIYQSISAADFGYSRLKESLAGISTPRGGGPRKIEFNSLAFIDSWTILDSCNRLGGLVKCTPKWAKVPVLRRYLDRMGPVVAMRNGFQHLDNEVPRLAEKGMPAWGCLNWCSPSIDPRARGGTSFHYLSAGALPPGSRMPVDARWCLAPGESVGGVTFSAFGQKVKFADLMAVVEEVARHYESELEVQFNGLPSAGANYHLTATFYPPEVGLLKIPKRG